MSFFPHGGTNPAHGRDMGPPPPLGRGQGGFQPQPFSGFGGPGSQQPWFSPVATSSQTSPFPMWNAPQATQGFFTQGGGTHGPTSQPIINPALPAANMTNSTGGVGCEPGYNYFFPAEHVKIHVFRTGSTPPWQLPANFSAPFYAVHVPVNTTIGDLLKGFGATNPNPQKNKVVELHQGGNGRWYKGMSFRGDKDKAMEKTLSSVGWDSTRTGLPGGKPVVYLYVTKG